MKFEKNENYYTITSLQKIAEKKKIGGLTKTAIDRIRIVREILPNVKKNYFVYWQNMEEMKQYESDQNYNPYFTSINFGFDVEHINIWNFKNNSILKNWIDELILNPDSGFANDTISYIRLKKEISESVYLQSGEYDLIKGAWLNFSNIMAIVIAIIVQENNEKGMLFMETPLRMDPRLKIHSKKLKKFFCIHTTHYDLNFIKQGILRFKAQAYAMPVRDKSTTTIIPTKEQFYDIWKEEKQNNVNLEYIPHYINFIPKIADKNLQNRKIIISFARIDFSVTEFKLPIEAFMNSELANNDYEYHIYGDGPNKKELEKYISDNKWENKIKVNGYVETKEYFNLAIATINITKISGFGLVTLESLAYGVPVIASNNKYGNQDLIHNNQNGIILNEISINEITLQLERIITMIKNGDIEFTDIQNSVILKYSKERVKAKYQKILMEEN